MSSSDPRIETLMTDLTDLDISTGDRLVLAEDLQLAESINGSTDPVQQMFKRVLIGGVRNAVIQHKSLKQMSETHALQCPVLATAKAKGVTPMSLLSHDSDEDELNIPVIGKLRGGAAKIMAGALASMLLLGTAFTCFILYKDSELRKTVAGEVAAAIDAKLGTRK